ncbi:SusC/RagA family TonB-linked outer membrane protein, partial [Bacteroidota bacterium]
SNSFGYHIESIDVLKDGSAAAIYGTRGTNGVIFITTKRAKGVYTNSVEYSGYITKSTIAKKLEMMTADDYHNMVAEGIRDSSYVYDWDVSTDWQNELLQEPWSYVQNLTFRGGNEKTNYLASFSWEDTKGTIIGTENNVYTTRADINHNMLNNKLKLNIGVLSRFTKNPNNADGYSFSGYTWRQVLIHNPTEPVKNEDGTWYENRDRFNYENPLDHIYETSGYNKSNLNRVNATLTAEPIEGLELKSLMSYNRYNQTRTYYESRNHFHGALVDGFGSNGTQESDEKLLELTATYKKSIGKNRFSVLGGYSYQERDWFDFWINNQDFPTDMFGYSNLDLGQGYQDPTTFNSDTRREKTNLIGFFGRGNYSFDDKYLLMGSLRDEAGSQLVGAKNPWGLFPAVSAGWRISKEPFMQNLSFVDDIKLRAGWGITGSLPNRLYNAYETKKYEGSIEISGQDYLILTQEGNGYDSLRWEEKTEINFGIDFTLLKNRLSGNIDIYSRTVDNLLFDFQVPVPPNKLPTTYANAGKLENKGIEVMINIIPVQMSDFEWQTSISFSTNKNKLLSLGVAGYEIAEKIGIGNAGEPIWGATHKLEVGHPVGDLWAYKVVDIDTAGCWIYEVKYTDINGNDSITELVNYDDFSPLRGDDARQVIGNGIPDFYAGWNNTFKYKNFDLTITQRGAFGFQILNRSRMYYENTKYGKTSHYNQLKTAYDPIFGKVPLNDEEVDIEYNSYYIEDGDYWKIDNITLGYTFTSFKNPYIKSARIYASTLNTFTFTNYSGVDPEVRITDPKPDSNRFADDQGLQPGNDDRDKYPSIRSYTVGINLTF